MASISYDFGSNLASINARLDANDIDGYDREWSAYDARLDECARKLFHIAETRGRMLVFVIAGESDYSGIYTLSPTAHIGKSWGLAKHDGSGSARTLPLSDADDLSDWLCYIDGTVAGVYH